MVFDGLPYILVKNDIVEDSGDGFLELTGYGRSDIRDATLEHLTRNLLRMKCRLTEQLPPDRSVFIFTKELEPREVEIVIQTEGDSSVIIFSEKKDSRPDELFPHLMQQLHYNIIGNALLLAEGSVLLSANQRALDCFEKPYDSPFESIGKSIGELCTETAGAALEAAARRVAAYGKPFDSRAFCIAGRYFDIVLMPISADAHVKYLYATVRDVTENIQRRIELEEKNKKLKAQAERFDIVTKYMNDGLFIINSDGTYDYFNDHARRYTLNSENIKKVGDSFVHSRYFSPEGIRLSMEEFPSARVLRGEVLENVIIRCERDDNSEYYSYNGCPVYSEEGVLTSAFVWVKNITEAVEHEKRLLQTEMQLRTMSEELQNIIDSTDDLVWSVDLNGRLLYFNAAYRSVVEKTLGYSPRKGVLMKELFPDENESVWKDLHERAIKDGKFQVDLKSPHDDKVFAFSFYPVYVNSEIVEITSFAKDITDRVSAEQKIVTQNAELESLVRERTSELQRIVKNLQSFSLALSHDVKASYRDIELCAGRILDKTDIEANAERILSVSKDMTAFIQEILKYEMCTKRTIVKENVNLKRIFVSVYKELKNKYTNKSRMAFETGFPVVAADSILIRQVVYNILSNALKFSSKRELPKIKVGCMEDNREYVIYVEDNGVGFDMTDASKLFTAFERLHDKEDYEGTGLGLAIVRNIIHRHGGRTWIESESDVRTVFYFSLPIS